MPSICLAAFFRGSVPLANILEIVAGGSPLTVTLPIAMAAPPPLGLALPLSFEEQSVVGLLSALEAPVPLPQRCRTPRVPSARTA